jgi:hypothetical protein
LLGNGKPRGREIMTDKAQLRETDSTILEPNGPIKFVKVNIPGKGEAWVPPQDAYMLQARDHACVCEEWETEDVCLQWKGDVCVRKKTVQRCVKWHCGHNH